MLLPLDRLRASVRRADARQDPVGWVSTKLGEFTWSKQRTILESVRDHRRTAVHSCHTVGKSWIAARIAAWWIESHAPGEAFVVTSAPTGPQVKAILWKEIARAHSHGKLSGRLNQIEWYLPIADGREELVGFGRKPSDTDPSAFQGIHAPAVLVIFDEACGIPANLWEAADTLISNDQSRFLAIGNPDDPNTEFGVVCKPGSGWFVIGVGAFDTPNFTGEPVPASVAAQLVSITWQQEKLRKWGEDNPMYVSKVLGRFPQTATDGLIPMQWVLDAQTRDLSARAAGGPVELGIDVGGGSDRNVIAVRRGPVVRNHLRDQNPDTMQTLGNAMRAIQETGAVRAKIDAVGIGYGASNRAAEIASDTNEPPAIRQRAASIVGVSVGLPARNREAYINQRAEGYWALRDRFQSGEIDIDPDDEDLAAQLVDIRWRPTSRGQVQIESKEEMRKRGKSSPDDADAVMLAFYDPPVSAPEKSIRVGTWGRGRRSP